MRGFPAPVAVLLAALLLAGGCAGSDPTPAASPVVTGAPAGYAPGGGFNATDLAWLQLMRPMTEQSQRLLELVPGRAADPRLAKLATRATRDNTASLAELRRLLDRSGAPPGNPHEGHDMPGLLTAEKLTAIAATTGADFDRRFADGFRAYAEQCARLAGAEQKAGTDPGTTKLAATIESAATGQLALLPPPAG
jgi:uncharacterized protein (DUF305 family)